MAKPVPRPTPTEKAFYEGCRRSQLLLQQCDDCRHVIFYPRTHCDQCHSEQLSWHASSGHGVIASFTIVRRGVSADFEAPYVIALIDLDDGPRMMSQIIDCDPELIRVDQRVTVDFAPWSEEITLPVFKLHPASGEEKP